MIWVLAAGAVYIAFILSLLWILANLDPNSYGYPSSYQPEVSQQLTAGEIN